MKADQEIQKYSKFASLIHTALSLGILMVCILTAIKIF